MKKLIFCALFCGLSTVSTLKAQDVKLSIEKSDSTYQIRISPGTNTVEYDQRAFHPSSSGLCPWGAVAYLKDGRDVDIDCGQAVKGYSSSWMVSEVFFGHDYKLLPGTNDFVSGPYDISQVLTGIESHADIDSIRKIKIGFHANLRVNGVERQYVAESDWSPISAKTLKSLHAQENPAKSAR